MILALLKVIHDGFMTTVTLSSSTFDGKFFKEVKMTLEQVFLGISGGQSFHHVVLSTVKMDVADGRTISKRRAALEVQQIYAR